MLRMKVEADQAPLPFAEISSGSFNISSRTAISSFRFHNISFRFVKTGTCFHETETNSLKTESSFCHTRAHSPPVHRQPVVESGGLRRHNRQHRAQLHRLFVHSQVSAVRHFKLKLISIFRATGTGTSSRV